MRVIVGDRGSGRTTSICRWLMQGHRIGNSWSRAIVVATNRERLNVTRTLRYIAERWPGEQARHSVLWLLPGLVHTIPGDGEPGPFIGAEVEYAIDDLESVLVKLAVRLGARQLPSVVSINGEASVRSVVNSREE